MSKRIEHFIFIRSKKDITASTLKTHTCDYKGHRITYNEKHNLYEKGRHFCVQVDYYKTIKELKLALP